ncbi:hypothetical protein OH460_14940 [Vibrio sp. Makdt]|uniref:Ig-like domain-containing protein n=1 Tax=Vibrio sp. Makdt TaxID=2998828 RepID=UPI0022CDB239|nr:hypothetical protein [Vibrio sp. Makdt]MDA0153613.1 hypothetical protein [Vibrio sp. Makdt]
MKVINLGVIALGISALTACGGGSGDSDVSSQPVQPSMPSEVSIEAAVIQSKALVDVQSQVIVQADSDVDLRLTSVTAVKNQPACKVTSLEGMTFSILSDQVGECQFEYTVEPVEQSEYIAQASSLARVSVSQTAEDNTLPNLSATTNIESPVTIDLSAELESALDTSIYAVSEEATLLGTGSVEIDSFSNTITYTPTDIGVTRIMYSMTDGTTTKLGNIDVAVSDTGNTPPVANDYIREGKLAKDMSVEIDLTDYVSDAEDCVILDSVRAYNAETKITSATDHTFTFQSPEAGPHEVAYTVTDGRGGYAVGQVYIEVEPDFSLVQDWEDITIYDPTIGTDITFTAPASKVLADYTNTAYTSSQEQDGFTGPKYSEVVTMNLEQAQNYCASRNGRLPISREWELLLANKGSLFESNNWPAGTPFWSSDMVSETSGKTINIVDGNVSELTKTKGEGFAACILLDNPLIKDFSTNIQSENNLNAHLEHFLSFYVSDPDGSPAPYQDLRTEIGGAKGVFSNGLSNITLVTDSAGEASETYLDTSFNHAVLSTQVSSNSEDAIAIEAAIDEMFIDTTDASLWNIAEVLGGNSFRSIDEQGIPLNYKANQSSEVTAVYKNAFIGRNVVARYRLKANDVASITSGKLNWVLQQFGNSPNTVDWGYSNAYQEGLPHSSAVISNEINYYSQNIITTVGSSYIGGEESFFVSLPTRYEYWYVWITIEGDKLSLYTNTHEERPAAPTFSIQNVWRDIDPSKPYWVGFGGNSGDGVSDAVSIYANALWMGTGG